MWAQGKVLEVNYEPIEYHKGKNKNGSGIMKIPVPFFGGDDRDRTDYLLNAIQALSQVSYAPKTINAIFQKQSLASYEASQT